MLTTSFKMPGKSKTFKSLNFILKWLKNLEKWLKNLEKISLQKWPREKWQLLDNKITTPLVSSAWTSETRKYSYFNYKYI